LKPQHCPYLPNPIKYSKDNQLPSPINNSPLLDKAGKKRVQQIVGSQLYYARAVDPTILMALPEISSQQAAPTENTMKRVNHFLDYMWIHPDAVIRYRRILPTGTKKHAAEPVVISSSAAYHTMATPLNSTAPSVPNAPPSNSLLHPQPKLNWVHCF
jgi:hypothetical protein